MWRREIKSEFSSLGKNRPFGARSLTASRRSESLPRHETDLSTEESEAQPSSRFSPADADGGGAKRAEAPAGQGSPAARGVGAEKVAWRISPGRRASPADVSSPG